MFIEYNWTAYTYQIRFGDTFTDFRGARSFDNIREWRRYLKSFGFNFHKVSSNVWEVYKIESPV